MVRVDFESKSVRFRLGSCFSQ